MSKQQFEECIGGLFKQATANNKALGALKCAGTEMPFTGQVAGPDQCLRIQDYDNGDMIIQQNTAGESFYIIKAGKVDLFRDNVALRTITKLDYFGERSILFNESRTAMVIANGVVSCWVLRQQDFTRLIDESIFQNLVKRSSFRTTPSLFQNLWQ